MHLFSSGILVVCACTAWAADVKPGKPVEVDIGSFANQGDGWTFYGGWEFKGATGTLVRSGDAGHAGPGAARLNGDFSAGGFYVGMKVAKLELPITDFSYWVKPEGIEKTMGVRLTDEGGQTFQYTVRLAKGDDWQRVTIQPGTTTAQGHFGGSNNGVWQGKLSGAMITFSKHDCRKEAIGSCLIDDITVTVTKPKP